MVSRKELKQKATSAGKSIAGTLGEAKRSLKSKLTRSSTDSATGVTLGYSEEADKWIVIDPDGRVVDTFDDKMQAASRARELKRGIESSESASDTPQTDSSKAKQVASNVASGVKAGASKAAAKAREAGENVDVDAPESDGMQDRQESNPDLSFLTGETGGESNPELDFGGGFGGKGEPELPFMQESDGQETEPQLPFMEDSGGPDGQLPFMGGQESDEEPQVPMFGGMENDGPGMAFGFGGSEDMEMNGFGFGPSESAESEDGDQPPWMF